VLQTFVGIRCSCNPDLMTGLLVYDHLLGKCRQSYAKSNLDNVHHRSECNKDSYMAHLRSFMLLSLGVYMQVITELLQVL
jgi:hypothetical protein